MTTFLTVSSSYYNGYGLGCMRFPYMGRTYWGHAGNFWGYAACMMYYPQDSICVTALINIDCYGSNASRPLIDALLNDIATAIHEQKAKEDFVLYPNPVSSQFAVGSLQLAIETIEIYNSIGEKMTTKVISTDPNKMIVDVSDFSPGIYFVKIISENASIIRRLIVD